MCRRRQRYVLDAEGYVSERQYDANGPGDAHAALQRSHPGDHRQRHRRHDCDPAGRQGGYQQSVTL